MIHRQLESYSFHAREIRTNQSVALLLHSKLIKCVNGGSWINSRFWHINCNKWRKSTERKQNQYYILVGGTMSMFVSLFLFFSRKMISFCFPNDFNQIKSSILFLFARAFIINRRQWRPFNKLSNDWWWYIREGLKIVQNLMKSPNVCAIQTISILLMIVWNCFISFFCLGVHPAYTSHMIYINGFVQTSSKSLDINT